MLSKTPLAIVTMAYNEAELLPVWVRHYSRQVGPEHCYILDHGSSDGSTRDLPVNVVRWPRCPHDEHLRAVAASDFCASLLYAYDRVLFTDADEIVVADPSLYEDLVDFVRRRRELGPVVSAFGVDVLHDHTEEPPLEWSWPISAQRRQTRPFNSLCKPTLIAQRVEWAAGFHYCRQAPLAPIARDLYLFHLAFCDSDLILRRQVRRNAVEKAQRDHHQLPPQPLLDHIQASMLSLPRQGQVMGSGSPEFERTKVWFARELPHHRFVQTKELWELPARFRGTF
jgi:hypothetical protein